MRRIESRSNPLIVATGKLASKKYREETRTFFFEGAHLLEEYLRFGHIPRTVFMMDDAERKYATLLSGVPDTAIVSVPENVFSKLSTEQAPQGILTVSDYLDDVRIVSHADQTPSRVLLLQSVRDNGNVGTVIRTAAALNWTVVLSEDCADVYASKTVRATMGALFANGVCICKDPVAYVRSFATVRRRTFAAALYLRGAGASPEYARTFFEEEFENYKAKFEEAGITYFYTLIDDAVARVIRSKGGFIWACKNYDGDVMSDMVSTAFGSLAMMTSVLVSPDGKYEYEAAHGTVTRHYYRHLKGEETSTNPIATIYAWSGALRKRGEMDNLADLMHFADNLEGACIDTLMDGIMTKDLTGLVVPGTKVEAVNSIDFIKAIRARLEKRLA